MRLSLLLACLPLAACSPAAENESEANVAAVNVVAGDSVDAPSETPEPLTPPAPGTPGGLPDDRTPVSEAPFTAESAQGGANVVQTYYALIGEGRFRQAWALWEQPGMDAQAFGASFSRYSEYHANIGAPGEIDAGAGQRFVTVPVQVYGRMKDGRQFSMLGTVTLHRTDVDGASKEQRSWRIRSTDIKPGRGQAGATPQPSPRATEDNRSVARYRCMDGTKMTVRYDPDNARATVVRGGKAVATLRFRPGNSGIHYSGGGYDLRGKGYDLSFTAPNLPPIACTAIR